MQALRRDRPTTAVREDEVREAAEDAMRRIRGGK